jgi:hypothetical protein
MGTELQVAQGRDYITWPASNVQNSALTSFARYRIGRPENGVKMLCRTAAGTTASKVRWLVPDSDINGCSGSGWQNAGSTTGCRPQIGSVKCYNSAMDQTWSHDIPNAWGAWQEANAGGSVCDYVSVDMNTCSSCSDYIVAISSIQVSS